MAALGYSEAVVSTFPLFDKQRHLKAGTVASFDTMSLPHKATKQLPNTLCLLEESAMREDAEVIEQLLAQPQFYLSMTLYSLVFQMPRNLRASSRKQQELCQENIIS